MPERTAPVPERVRPPVPLPPHRQLGSATDSLALVARVLALASQPGEDALAYALAGEAARLLGMPAAALITLPAPRRPARGSPPPAARSGPSPRASLGAGDRAGGVRRRTRAPARRRGGSARRAAPQRRRGAVARCSSGCPRRRPAAPRACSRSPAPRRTSSTRRRSSWGSRSPRPPTAAFAHQATGLEHRHAADQNAALARAAKTLNESLDLSTLLGRICQEAATLIGAESAVVYRVTDEDELSVEAAHGLPPEHLGMTHGGRRRARRQGAARPTAR